MNSSNNQIVPIICKMAYFTANNLLHLGMRESFMKKITKLKIPLPKPEPKEKAAVLVPFCVVNNCVSLLYTTRSLTLRSHGGQIAFPGGKLDKGETAIQAALRETEEEIGLRSGKIDIWGCGPIFPGRNNKILITPVIGTIIDLSEEDLNINKKEVQEVFTISLESLCEKKNHYHTQYRNGYILPVFEVDGYKIWGLTAYITHSVLRCLLPSEVYHNDWIKKKVQSIKSLQE